MSDKKVVEIKNLVKSYGEKNFQTTVLKGIDMSIYKDDFIAVMGPYILPLWIEKSFIVFSTEKDYNSVQDLYTVEKMLCQNILNLERTDSQHLRTVYASKKSSKRVFYRLFGEQFLKEQERY